MEDDLHVDDDVMAVTLLHVDDDRYDNDLHVDNDDYSNLRVKMAIMVDGLHVHDDDYGHDPHVDGMAFTCVCAWVCGVRGCVVVWGGMCACVRACVRECVCVCVRARACVWFVFLLNVNSFLPPPPTPHAPFFFFFFFLLLCVALTTILPGTCQASLWFTTTAGCSGAPLSASVRRARSTSLTSPLMTKSAASSWALGLTTDTRSFD